MPAFDETFWRDRRVLVTGATGLLGCQLIQRLLERGAEVTGLVRDWIPSSPTLNPPLVDRVALVRGDLEDHALILRTLTEHEIDTVFHLGAQTIVRMGARSAVPTFETNIAGTWNVLEACRYCSDRVDRVLIASSHRVYGPQAEKLVLAEDAAPAGFEVYDVSKACAEALTRAYFLRERLPTVIARMGNLYGPGDLNYSRLIPATIRRVLSGKAPLVSPDATMIRGLLYVEDAAEACLRLMQGLSGNGVAGETFNVSDEKPVTVRQIVRLLLQLMNRADLAPAELDREPCREPLQRLDCGKIERTIGWRPRFSLEMGLKRTIDWYAQFLNSGSDGAHPFPSETSARSFRLP